MTHLDIRVINTTGGNRLDGALLTAEIIDADSGELLIERSLQVGDVTGVEVTGERHVVRARFPGGRLIQVAASSEGEVDIPAPPSQHEWLSWETAAGQAPAPERYRSHRRSAAETPWVQLWGANPQPWPASYSESDLISWKITFKDLLPRGMNYVLIGSPAATPRVSVLPAESLASIAIRPVAPMATDGRGMAVSVSIASDLASKHDRQVDSVLRYLSRGEVETGRMVAAERLLFEKLADPTGAAIGGYYLLKAGEYGRLHYWPGNFENWKSYLPDAAIIHGLQMLWDPQQRDLEAAADSLVRAANLGPPLLTVGLRMLRQGLHFLGRQSTDAAIDSARSTVMSYAEAVDWTQPFTTFWATSPLTPDAAATPGIPADRAHLEWLPRRPGLYAFPDTKSLTDTVEPRAAGGWQVHRVRGKAISKRVFATKREAVVFASERFTPSAAARLVVLRADRSIERVKA